MCDDYWDTADAQVVCRQLGYPTNNSVAFSILYGNTYVFMDDVSCESHESSLVDCKYNDDHNCHQKAAAGVKCGKVKAMCTHCTCIIYRMHLWRYSSC